MIHCITEMSKIGGVVDYFVSLLILTVKLCLESGYVLKQCPRMVMYRLCGGSKRHSLQAVELSQWSQAAVQIVSNLPDLPFFGHAGHADPLDGWRCCSQKRVMSRPIQVRQL